MELWHIQECDCMYDWALYHMLLSSEPGRSRSVLMTVSWLIWLRCSCELLLYHVSPVCTWINTYRHGRIFILSAVCRSFYALTTPRCSFHARGHDFLRNDLPTETCEVIYQSDHYRSRSSIWVVSTLLFTFSHPPGHGVWGIAEKEGSIFLHQIALFQFRKLCFHFSYLNCFTGWGKSLQIFVDETIFSGRTETAKWILLIAKINYYWECCWSFCCLDMHAGAFGEKIYFIMR